ncbi:GumC family protein [Robiginitalea aurantiaca]|uniref:Polysaccharide biosynthesis tyrosine autokinase n=1 Tax=Robiginitalea aurantiaca TaxID=3056915 RepID=A0ABT7WDY8_9FLAO|nr:tyrosine-protein kinase family protein [Robiginitalea aurantiaca]MDM9631131.1 polysaccharide biosynthesis tyrosine autokinase [Robiginitalea aurantiaca]
MKLTKEVLKTSEHMQENPFDTFIDSREEDFDLKGFLLKYLNFWYLFLFGLLFALLIGYLYLRYTPQTYYSEAKIKILKEDDKNVLDLGGAAVLGNSQLNLHNEVLVIKSYRLLKQVVELLHLDIDYYLMGDVRDTQVWNVPFIIERKRFEDKALGSGIYLIQFEDDGFLISREEETPQKIAFNTPDSLQIALPFTIKLSDPFKKLPSSPYPYKIVFSEPSKVALALSQSIEVWPTEDGSEILSLALFGQSRDRSEAILNAVVEKFNQDGMIDRQEVTQRTIDFINRRFIYLSKELDSIETRKQSFKEAYELTYIEADASLALQQKSETELRTSNLETQLSLAKMLKENLEAQNTDSLLPGDIGLENLNLNTLVLGYNELILRRDMLSPNMGEDNPTLHAIDKQLERRKKNILNSLDIYEAHLLTSLTRLQEDQATFDAVYAQLPEEERMLRAIERQQNLKENLFLVLLQKREEAGIKRAVTAPSIKVIDYALSSGPIAPKKISVYGICAFVGFLVPFAILFILFTLDNKLYHRKELEKALPDLPIAGEIPHIPRDPSKTHERSELAESFRILVTNIKFLLKTKSSEKGKVGMVTSSVKGEGKTLIAIELARAYSSLNQKVLLVGGDLRNPRLHEFFGSDKNVVGFSNYLSEPDLRLKDCLQNPDRKFPYLSICFSGPIPPNAPQLLSGERYLQFLRESRDLFDVVILDTAPTVLVTDSLIMDDPLDLVLYVVRSGHTEKQLTEHIKNLQKSGKMQHMALLLNDVKRTHAKGYNYGYGYGYSDQKKKTPWYKSVFGKGG